MSVRLEDVLTFDEAVRIAGTHGVVGDVKGFGRACIRLAVEKAEKVEGFVANGITVDVAKKIDGIYFHPTADDWTHPRHALLLLGPNYEPKPVKTAEERIKEALSLLETYRGIDGLSSQLSCILRGESR